MVLANACWYRSHQSAHSLCGLQRISNLGIASTVWGFELGTHETTSAVSSSASLTLKLGLRDFPQWWRCHGAFEQLCAVLIVRGTTSHTVCTAGTIGVATLTTMEQYPSIWRTTFCRFILGWYHNVSCIIGERTLFHFIHYCRSDKGMMSRSPTAGYKFMMPFVPLSLATTTDEKQSRRQAVLVNGSTTTAMKSSTQTCVLSQVQ